MENIYKIIVFAVIILLLIFFFVFRKKYPRNKRFTNYELLGIMLVIVSMFFSDANRYLGYGIMGAGIIIAVYAAVRENRRKL